MKMIYKSKEANLKHAESLISTGDKFYWLPHAMIFGYFFNLEDISKIENNTFYIMLIVFALSIYIGLKLKNKGLEIYDHIYYTKVEDRDK